MKRTAIIFLLIFLGSRLVNAQSAKKLYNDVQKNKIKVIFHGLGTEPFWDVFILQKGVLFVNEMEEEYKFFSTSTSFEKQKKIQVIKCRESSGATTELKIIRQPCNDGMSESVYSYKVIFGSYEGCGM
jgi:uncharacterized membrane protein